MSEMMARTKGMSPELERLIELARDYVMPPEEVEEQKRSFAYGQVAIENPDVTREMVEDAAGVNYPLLLLKYLRFVYGFEGGLLLPVGAETPVYFSERERAELLRLAEKARRS